MDPTRYDLVILGGGSAAFAAITAADDRDLSTAIVNAGLPIGGTCVNVGCVPSKHLLAVAETAYEPPQNPFNAITYRDDQPTIDWSAAIEEKDTLVTTLREQNYIDVANTFDVDIYHGRGRLQQGPTIDIAEGEDANTQITGEKVLIATGSSPWIAPIDGIDDIDYETSETILERQELPSSFVIIGGGYVAMEWGQILNRMGVDVTILQRSGHVLSDFWEPLGQNLETHLQQEGITVVTNVSFDQIRTQSNGDIQVNTTVDTDERTFSAQELFVATGVTPNTADIGLDTLNIGTDENNAIRTTEYFKTNHSDVYAAGDCIGSPMLETVAAKEGNRAVNNAFGDTTQSINYSAVPTVIYTSPEVATVGVTEPEYMNQYGTCTCRTVQMENLPKAKTVKDTRGFLQVVKHHETDDIVGVHMVGPRAADIISEATLAVKHGLSIHDIIDTIHPFPTFSEAFKQACQAFNRDISNMSCCIE